MPAADVNKNPAELIAHLEGVLSAEPGSERFWELADAYTRAGRFPEATEVCRRGLALHANSARGFLALGRALFGIGRLNAAAGSLRRAIDLEPDTPEGYRLLGELLLRRGIHTEAVALLERALERGVGDRRLQKLHARAVDALEAQATTVAHAPDEPRGMGNVAVAGTISRVGGAPQAELDEEEDDDDLLLRRRDLAEAEERALALRAFRGEGQGRGREPEGVAWQSLEQAWEARLDAQRGARVHTDPDVPVRAGAVDIELAPLSDPLAEGMPPLPDATSEVELPDAPVTPAPEPPASLSAAEQAAADAAHLAKAAAEMESSASLPVPIEDTSEEEEPTALAIPRGVAADEADFVEEPTTPGPVTTPALEVAAKAPKGRGDGRRKERDDGALLRDLAGPDPTEAAELPTEFIPRDDRRGRGVGRWIVVLLVLGALGAGGYLGWRFFEARQRATEALEFARKARRAGTAAALKEALGGLEAAIALRVQAQRGELRRERALLRALAWLWHGAGAAPVTKARRDAPWRVRAAAAAGALARGEGGIAGLLGAIPEGRQERALHQTLLGLGHWRAGRVEQSRRALDEALRSAPLSAAVLARGHLDLALGYTQEAIKRYQRILEAHPGHRLAALALVAARHGAKPAAEGLSPRAQAWRRVLAARRGVVAGDKKAAAEMRRGLTAARSDRDLMMLAARVQAAGCAFAAVDENLARLARQSEDKGDRALRSLRGEVAARRGLGEKARGLLSGKGSRRERLLRAWLLLLAGDVKAAAPFVVERSRSAEILRVFADGLTLLRQQPPSSKGRGRRKEPPQALQKRVFEPLAVLARRHPRARLALLLLRHRGERQPSKEELDRLANGVRALPPRGALRARGGLLLARSQRRAGQPLRALETLEDAEARCPGFAPLAAAKGRLLLSLERREAARRWLSKARAAGLDDASTTIALARATLPWRPLGPLRSMGGRPEVARARALLAKVDGRRSPSKGAPVGAVDRARRLLEVELSLASSDLTRLSALLAKSAKVLGARGAWLQVRAAVAGGAKTRKAAKLALDGLLQAEPRHVWGRLLAARWALAERRGELKAKPLFGELLREAKAREELSPWARAWALWGLARIASRRGDQRSAARLARRAIALVPRFAEAQAALGAALLAQGRRKEAAAALTLATKLDSKDADSLYALGRALRRGAAAKRAYTAFLRVERRTLRARRVRRRLRRMR